MSQDTPALLDALSYHVRKNSLKKFGIQGMVKGETKKFEADELAKTQKKTGNCSTIGNKYSYSKSKFKKQN